MKFAFLIILAAAALSDAALAAFKVISDTAGFWIAMALMGLMAIHCWIVIVKHDFLDP